MKEKFRRFLEWIKRPHGLPLAGLYLVTAAVIIATTLILVHRPEGTGFAVLSYLLYALAALLSGYSVYTVVIYYRTAYLRIAERNAFVGRLTREYDFRTFVFSLVSLIVGGVITAYYSILFTLSLSVWYGALAVYYLLLSLTRSGILLSRKIGSWRGDPSERVLLRSARTYLGCGAMLVLLSLAFSAVLILTVFRGFHAEYAGLTIYFAAFYAFWKIGSAIANFFKAKKEDLFVRSLRNINIADALVSVIALQAAMLQVFMTESETLDPARFNAVSGSVAVLLILFLGSYMIVRGHHFLDGRDIKSRKE